MEPRALKHMLMQGSEVIALTAEPEKNSKIILVPPSCDICDLSSVSGLLKLFQFDSHILNQHASPA